MLRAPLSSLILATSLVACATDPGSDSGGGGGKADGSTTTIAFDADWSETASGALLAGTTVRIDYDLDRLTACRGETGGSEVWGVTGYAQFDDAAPVTFAVSRLDGGHVVPVVADVAIPASASKLQLWFSESNRWGCIAYDSNTGANYGFAIDRHGLGAVLAFDADGTHSQSGTIHAGDQVVVHYDPERLAQCAGSSAGHPVWGVTGYWQVDGGTVHSLQVGRTSGSSLVAGDPVLTAPRGHDLALWFEASNIWGCHAYDSAFGANYHAAIE